MGIKKSTRPRLRRVATVIAAFGALTMSSGVALLATAPTADAAKNPVNICHATGSDSNPYRFITVDDDSAKLQGHLMHRNDPNKTWKSTGVFNGVGHDAGDPKPDLIASFTDDDGVFHEYDGDITAATCGGEVTHPLATADVDVTQPTCENDNTPSLDPVAENATYDVDASLTPGGHWVVTFTANKGYTFDGDEQKELVISGDFDAAESPCGVVNPPTEVTPVAPEFTEPDCDTAPAVVLPDPTPVTSLPGKKAAGPVIETADVDGVHYVVTGSLTPGGTVEVDATAIEPNVLAEGATTHWSHTFDEVGECGAVDVPTETPSPTEAPVVATPSVATPTVVHAGLTGATVTNDLRSEQGLALLVSGMIMMVVAGGLGLRPVRGASRS